MAIFLTLTQGDKNMQNVVSEGNKEVQGENGRIFKKLTVELKNEIVAKHADVVKRSDDVNQARGTVLEEVKNL